jgi:acetyl esterase
MLAARTGSTWLSVGYRRCPDIKYPTPLLDCQSVVDWALELKTSNPKIRVGLCGDSSGGQIAAMLAHKYKSKIDFQILVYPLVSFGAHYASYKE